MTFDLTTVLTTIAAASASIVAILGGFIASKLISISSERDEVLSRLQDINEEIDYRTKVLNKAQTENDEEDALDFILPHVDDLPRYDVRLIYQHEEHPKIALEKLIPYWEMAKVTYAQFHEAYIQKQIINSDNVPVGVAEAFKNNDFSYEICKKIGSNIRKLEKQQERNRRRQQGLWDADMLTSPLDDIDLGRMKPLVGNPYIKNEEIIQEQSTSIGWLTLQREQYTKKQTTLVKPKGMREGLIIFALFSMFCIILPLLFSPFSTENYTSYCIVKGAFILFFAIGLSAIFGYLIWLLKWNQEKKG